MKQYNFCRAVPMVWVATLTLAGSLLVRGFQTVAFGVRFPDHLMFTLLGLLVLCWFVTGARELAAQDLLSPDTTRGLLSILAHGEVRHQGRRGRGPIFHRQQSFQPSAD